MREFTATEQDLPSYAPAFASNASRASRAGWRGATRLARGSHDRMSDCAVCESAGSIEFGICQVCLCEEPSATSGARVTLLDDELQDAL